jgi:peptidoglycan/LPS O-acetylase OafA/YrhL
MPNLAIGLGLALVVLGLGGYFLAPTGSLTALIPSILGALIALTGFIGKKPELRRHAMHAAAALALLGLLGTFGGVIALLGGTAARPVAATVQAITAVLCLVFLVFAVRSFIEARRGREQAA